MTGPQGSFRSHWRPQCMVGPWVCLVLPASRRAAVLAPSHLTEAQTSKETCPRSRRSQICTQDPVNSTGQPRIIQAKPSSASCLTPDSPTAPPWHSSQGGEARRLLWEATSPQPQGFSSTSDCCYPQAV